VVTENLYEDWAEFSNAAYAFGWRVQSYRGHNCIFHGGGGIGFTARVTFLPQDFLGIVILSNLANSEAPEILTWSLLDWLLDLPGISWVTKFFLRRKQRADKKKRRTNRKGISPAIPLKDYVGIYRHPGYGRLRVRVHRGKLKINHVGWPYEKMEYTLTAHAKGRFRLLGPPGADIGMADVQFHSNRQGQITSLGIPFEPLVGDILFRRIQDV
jgi:hypothetical protein